MNDSKSIFKLKNHFKSLNFYSMPTSILFVFRKRLNFLLSLLFVFGFFFFSIF